MDMMEGSLVGFIGTRFGILTTNDVVMLRGPLLLTGHWPIVYVFVE